ncbi:hypothetical protein NUKP64_50870 [Klebsiella variicola]|nr:hypothetical protein NUKP64_50870 [Klebsiella variicola]
MVKLRLRRLQDVIPPAAGAFNAPSYFSCLADICGMRLILSIAQNIPVQPSDPIPVLIMPPFFQPTNIAATGAYRA